MSRLQIFQDPRYVGGHVGVDARQALAALLGAKGDDADQVHRVRDAFPGYQRATRVSSAGVLAWNIFLVGS